MTTANIQSLNDLGIIAKADTAAKAPRAVMVVMSANWLVPMLQVHRSRRHLARLTDYQLADIGLSEAQRQAEVRKPFWNIQGPGR